MTYSRTPYLLALGLAVAAGLVMILMGRNLICPCGDVLIWGGNTPTEQSSQHLTDWYTPSHLLHGLLFYAALWLVARRMPVGWRFLIAMAVECAWEVVENTEWVISRYRDYTVSFDYNGDAVINAMVDIAAMALGFWLAHRLPVWASVAVVIGFEALTMTLIRDGLALNVLMLVWPLDSVLQWQQGG